MIDLSLLPAPNVIETLDFETLFQQRKARLLELTAAEDRPALARTLALESEPLVKLLQENAYREMVLRARINDAAKASLLAHASGTDLDNRVADYGVQRLLIRAADLTTTPPAPAIWESDNKLRYRAQMALEGLSVAGSRGAYLFHCLSASALVADASVDSPVFTALPISDAVRSQLPAGALVLVCTDAAGLTSPLPGDVSIAILPTDPALDGAALALTVQAALSADDVRPLTDRPRVQAGQPNAFRITAQIEIENGPDSAAVMAAARAGLNNTLASTRKLGSTLSRSALFAALHVAGVRRVTMSEPAADISCDARHFPQCDAIHLEAA